MLVEKRTENAHLLDEGLRALSPNIKVPYRPPENRESFQLYLVLAKRRNELVNYLVERGVEAKIHYPIPIHLQEAAKGLGYKKGDFPVCEQQAEEILTLPAHQFISHEQIQYMISEIRNFYSLQS
jgi:dTDP-4-amino-4,6-dideoxygalactose transaminase